MLLPFLRRYSFLQIAASFAWSILVLMAALCPLTTTAQDYLYVTNSSSITITKYLGSGGVVIIPEKINGLPVTSIGDNAFAGGSGLTTVTIPNTVTSIGSFAFDGCAGLSSITIPDGVTSIGAYAFKDCWSLANVAIPSSVTRIGTYAFIYSKGLLAITVDALNAVYSSVDGVLFNKSKTTLIQWPGGKV